MIKVSETWLISLFAIPVFCPDVASIHFVVFYVEFGVNILIIGDLKIFH